MRNGNKHRLKLMNAGAAKEPCDFESMSTDEMWILHEKITASLARKLVAEKTRLENRLHTLKQGSNPNGKNLGHARRPYPQVFQNTKILPSRSKLGPVAGGSPAGYQHNSDPEKNSTIFEFNRLTNARRRAR
jgi:hypothetical protein